MERLQKKIANNSQFSRRKAEELIQTGNVKVNDIVITELGTKVSDKDSIQVNNSILIAQDKIYFLLNKPKGYICSRSDEKDRETVVDIIKRREENKRLNIYPVGRLDFNTTGLLLLTNDGELTNLLTHPKNMINKTYVAKVKGEMSRKNILDLKNGIYIDGYKTQKCKVQIERYNQTSQVFRVKLVIHEGKNHQIKKMFETIGGKVTALNRSEYAFLTTEGLKQGEYRDLTFHEIKQLFGMNKNGKQ